MKKMEGMMSNNDPMREDVALLILHAKLLKVPTKKIGEIWGDQATYESGNHILALAEKTLGLPLAYTESENLELQLEYLYDQIDFKALK